MGGLSHAGLFMESYLAIFIFRFINLSSDHFGKAPRPDVCYLNVE